MGTAEELWTRLSTKGLSLISVFFTRLRDDSTLFLVDAEKVRAT